MVVEVLPAQVGEGGHVEDDAVHPVCVQRVGGDLDGGGPPALVAQVGQQALEDRGLGCGAGPVQRADDTGGQAGTLEDGPDHVGHGGLPVGAGDADHGEVPGRMAEEGRRHPGHGRPDGARGHPDLGDIEIEEVLAEERRGTGSHGLRRVPVAVGVGSRQAAEQRSRPDPATVELDGADLGGRRVPTHIDRVDVVDHCAHLHGRKVQGFGRRVRALRHRSGTT